MSIEANAIIGLFFWAWSHQVEHIYDRRGGRGQLVFGVVLSLIAAYWFVLAVARMIGWVR